jgi:hypothetical protein
MSLSLQPGFNESSFLILHQNHEKRNCEKERKNLDAMNQKHYLCKPNQKRDDEKRKERS